MGRTSLVALALAATLALAYAVTQPAPPVPTPAASPTATEPQQRASVDQNAPYFEACAREGLNDSECVGRLIWFKATGGNERFHTYTFQQRIGVLVDWFRVLRADQRDDRFRAWGIINDPACCKPGDANCPAKSLDETFGFEWCPGDDVLLRFVGKPGYVDPACELKDAPIAAGDPHARPGAPDPRQSACDLRFGTSTGALGFRKFPNPNFDLEKWRKLNGGLASWEGFNRSLAAQTGVPSDQRVTRLADASIEPPFRIGTTCGSCHIAFDPRHPPADPANPKWENIKGLIGNQYTRMSELLGSGMPRSSLEWQMFAHPRPGVTDTSAISHDQINNPGTINAIINTSQRPTFTGEVVNKWRKAASCGAEKDESKCWCEPGHEGKCWLKSSRSDDATVVRVAGKQATLPGVHHILKGGEDSIGGLEAIQRVYLNIGSCSEQCWVNHLSDLRVVDPLQRGFGQTAFNIGQCRRDCPNFRAIEDRLDNLLDFFLSAEADATDLDAARNAQIRSKSPGKNYGRADLVRDLEAEFGKGAVSRGRTLFAQGCARCHSSLADSPTNPLATRDFDAPADGHPRAIRADFMGNDRATPVTEVGTFRCRALHSNHLPGNLYAEYASDTLHQRPLVADIPEREALKNGGRGHYRNISLLNVWATAPFMHNNAIGPEICGKPANKGNDFFRARYVDEQGRLLAQQPECLPYDPSVEGRFELYKHSMIELLNPGLRGSKATLTDADLIVDLGPRSWDGKQEKSLLGIAELRVPKGARAGALNGLQHKQLIADLYLAKRDPAALEAGGRKALAPTLRQIVEQVAQQPTRLVDILGERREFLDANYQSCTQFIENEGHRFGEDLSAADKKALIAFVATF
ncbi:cytochrome c [Rivibacter subsaxonicus]|uniref:Cytochrome c domain-containing protein n=1 Tax=Rivibacter subsaxonicus TaxID=457575 RepID=A0A4Q7W0X2_9BURK|nr:cytochrome c [Rivibacter subsaxonicus]RZU02485.1 hypothetical protein EV670_0509 [Rivibacter subsaxonicus]